MEFHDVDNMSKDSMDFFHGHMGGSTHEILDAL